MKWGKIQSTMFVQGNIEGYDVPRPSLGDIVYVLGKVGASKIMCEV